MDPALLPEDARAAVERIGTADIVVGLATAGPAPALATVAAAVRTGLDTHFPGQSAAIAHVDQARSEETTAAVAAALGDLRVVSVGSASAAKNDILDWSAAVHAVLRLPSDDRDAALGALLRSGIAAVRHELDAPPDPVPTAAPAYAEPAAG